MCNLLIGTGVNSEIRFSLYLDRQATSAVNVSCSFIARHLLIKSIQAEQLLIPCIKLYNHGFMVSRILHIEQYTKA